jgi:hypothetical protein
VDVLDWVKKRMDDPATPQKGGPAASDVSPNLRGANPVSALVELGTRLEATRRRRRPQGEKHGAGRDTECASAVHVAALVTQYLNNAAGTQAAREASWKSLVGFQFHLTQALCASAGAQLTPKRGSRPVGLPHPRQAASHALRDRAGAPLARRITCTRAPRRRLRHHADARTVRPRTMTTVEQELLRLLMLQVSAPDMLAPEEIELADRIVERRVPSPRCASLASRTIPSASSREASMRRGLRRGSSRQGLPATSAREWATGRSSGSEDSRTEPSPKTSNPSARTSLRARS